MTPDSPPEDPIQSLPGAPAVPEAGDAGAGPLATNGLAEDSLLAEASAALREAEDRYLRLLAEFDNYRRRALRERDLALEQGRADLARPLLPVLDNLERALSHSGDAPAPWRDGVAMTVRQFQDVLRNSGVVTVDPAGEPFDPRYHEAVTTQASAEVPADHVVQVVSRGYRLGDRILRPAGVIVSTGPGPQAGS